MNEPSKLKMEPRWAKVVHGPSSSPGACSAPGKSGGRARCNEWDFDDDDDDDDVEDSGDESEDDSGDDSGDESEDDDDDVTPPKPSSAGRRSRPGRKGRLVSALDGSGELVIGSAEWRDKAIAASQEARSICAKPVSTFGTDMWVAAMSQQRPVTPGIRHSMRIQKEQFVRRGRALELHHQVQKEIAMLIRGFHRRP